MMLSVIIQSLVLASGGILSFGSITIVILLLISDKGWRNGFGYMLGYVSAYTLIGVSVVVLSFNYTATDDASAEPSSIGAVFFMIMGILLLWLAFRNWRKPPSPEKKQPRLFAILDKVTPIKAFLLGALVSVINFKNLAIFLSAVSVLIVSELSLLSKIVIVLLDVFVFCLSVLIPVGIYIAFPQTARERLTWIRQTIEKYSRPIGIWVPLVFGIIFLVSAARELL